MSDQITFEHPLNEKSRILLRLSHLFEQCCHHLEIDTEWDSRAAIDCQINITSILSRADIKSELIKQLKNYDEYLNSISSVPGIDRGKLQNILQQLAKASQRVVNIEGQLGQQVRNNEFINSIIQRSSIPGGTFDFDLPEYHHWLNKPFQYRQQHLQAWQNELTPIRETIDLLLNMIRGSVPAEKKLAESGFFQQSLSGYRSPQLIRVSLHKDNDLFAEISGGKHRFSIRFLHSKINHPPKQSDQNIAFNLAICAL